MPRNYVLRVRGPTDGVFSLSAESGTYALTGSDATLTHTQAGVEPLFSDDFADATIGATSLAGRGSWTASRDLEVSDDLAGEGIARCLKLRYGTLSPHIWGEQRYDLGQNVSELWVELNLWFPDGTEGIQNVGIYENTNPNGGAGNNKLHTYWGHALATPNDDESGYDANFHNYEIWPGAGGDGIARMYCWHPPDYRPGGDIPVVNSGTRGRILQWRQYGKMNSAHNASDAESKTWLDGTLIEHVTGFYYTNDPAYSLNWRWGYVGGYDNSRFEHLTAIYVTSVAFYIQDPGW